MSSVINMELVMHLYGGHEKHCMSIKSWGGFDYIIPNILETQMTKIKGKTPIVFTFVLGKVQCECHLLLCMLSGGTDLTASLIHCFKS
jgi:hypothetical protein